VGRTCIASTAIALLAIRASHAEEPKFLLRDPSISKAHIVFSYANTIWVADRDGGNVQRLTTAGSETKPLLSGDGSKVAFVADYQGMHGIYVVSTSGGEPRQLTHHPTDMKVVGWTPDSKRVIFSSQRASFAHGVVQLFTVSVDGGFVRAIPLPRASEGSLSSDGARLAYVPNLPAQIAWKHYRGGQTRAIWIAKLEDSSIEAMIPRDNSDDFNPMWVRDSIYFLSNRAGAVTLFSYDTKSRVVKQLLTNHGLDIKSASASSEAIVYEQFGSLHVVDLQSGGDRALDIRPVADFPEVRPYFLHVTPNRISSVDISPTGARAVFGVRGEILTVPANSGDIRNLTGTVDAVERDPAWAPDGDQIAYLSDASGEYELYVRDQSGVGDVLRIALGNPATFYYSPRWSPDSRKIAFTDKRQKYWYVDVKRKLPVLIDTDLYSDPAPPDSPNPAHGLQVAWSPDSRWVAYTKQLPSHVHAVYVYSLEQAKSYQLTDGTSDAFFVAFDKGGDYLYFTASTDVGLATSWTDMTGLQHPITRNIYAVVLKGNHPSPMRPESDEESVTKVHTEKETHEPAEIMRRVSIDMEGIARRIVPLPIPARNYYGLFAGKSGVLFLLEGPSVDPFQAYFEGVGTATKVTRFDFALRKSAQILDGVSSVRISFDGSKMLYSKQNQWFITDVGSPAEAAAVQAASSPLKLEGKSIYVDPRAEWKHMFEQVWRDERVFFYDPNMHGLDLEAVKRIYRPYIENIASRADLNYLFNEMLGNLTVSHMFACCGDLPHPNQVNIGLLGADYAIENGRYRFTRIYPGDDWNPETRGPLAAPGLDVNLGDYLLAVDGHPVLPSIDIYGFFKETVGRQVRLQVGPAPDGRGSREITVIPVEDESALRNAAWIDDNRRKVDAMTGGRVAYIYLPDTGEGGYKNFNRYYFAQVGKQAAIIDERYNDGGDFPDYIIDYLRRPVSNYFNFREGRDITTPVEGIFGPKVMIINEIAASGGDLLPWMFRKAGIGPLVGRRTWGGAVGFYSLPGDLLDGGNVSTPNIAFYDTDGTWGNLENFGVKPDVDVEYDPKLVREGHDPQLEKAVEVTLDLLKKSPPPIAPHHPPYPRYNSSGIN
jgi:tricorn protease